MAAAAPKSVFAVAVNPSIGKNEELMQLSSFFSPQKYSLPAIIDIFVLDEICFLKAVYIFLSDDLIFSEFYAALDMFLTGIVKNADVVLPVRSVLETDGTAVSIESCIYIFI